jgi:hypothetical protein
MVAYEFYRRDEAEEEHLIGIVFVKVEIDGH